MRVVNNVFQPLIFNSYNVIGVSNIYKVAIRKDKNLSSSSKQPAHSEPPLQNCLPVPPEHCDQFELQTNLFHFHIHFYTLIHCNLVNCKAQRKL